MKAAVEIASRAYQDYAYVALYFPDDEERRRGLYAFMNCVMKRPVNHASTTRKQIPECGISVCSRSILSTRDKASAPSS